jgi:2-C-methyl-D-erythritol 4-phosphate cytidylyltransferase
MTAQLATNHCWAVVPAAGVGQRMQADRPKQYLPLADSTVLERTLLRLWDCNIFQKIVVSVSIDDAYWPTLPIIDQDWLIRADGGKQRADSVLSGLNALDAIADPNDWVFVHDAARPCLTSSDVLRLLSAIETSNDDVGGILALPVHDTLKRASQDRITETLDRNQIWRALTPQVFRLGILKQALSNAAANNVVATDEASAIEAMGLRPILVEGRADNIKITRPEDLDLASFYLEQQ